MKNLPDFCPSSSPRPLGYALAACAGLLLSAGAAIARPATPAPSAAPTAQAPAAQSAPVQLDWKSEEASLLRNHLQLTSRDMFTKAGESYFDHQTPPRWIVFQAVATPEKGKEPKPFYAMYVARLRYDETKSHIVGIDTPFEISPEGSANTCGWFHPTQPWRILFASTLVPPTAPESAGYQRGSSRYVWQFPSEMGIVERAVSAILLDIPTDHPMRAEVDRFQSIGDTYGQRHEAARKVGDTKKIIEAQQDFSREIAEGCPTLSTITNFRDPKKLFDLPRYDAECSYSPAPPVGIAGTDASEAGRFVLYAHVNPTASGGDDKVPQKTDADIHVFDTKTGKHHPLVVAPGYDGGPFFSPDGKFICYRSDRAGNDLLQLYVAELKFENDVPVGIVREKQLTSNEHVNWGPFWHPSGKFIVYATSEVGHSNYEVFAVESSGAVMDKPIDQIRRRRLTVANGADLLPSFSDDGRWMMWTAQRGPLAEGETRPSSQVWIAEVVPGAATMASPDSGAGLFAQPEKK